VSLNLGKAYLVGSGCGSIDLLTLKAFSLLQSAEVVIYDALVEGGLLDYAPAHCQRLNVGKRGGQPSLTQPEIDRLLVEHCQQGKQVVRLKSGDPFIFGRTTSEIQALRAAGIPYEVVPGISSAIAAPLLAHIPLTDVTLSRCFAVMSAHEPDELDWSTLANLDTLVILMGGQALPTIVERLIHRGKSTDTAIAVIRWAGQPQQQIWTGSLGSICHLTRGESLSPCVIVIGEVVRLRSYLQPDTLQPDTLQPSSLRTDDRLPLPLQNRTILVTRSAGQSSEFTRRLQAQGATVVEMPTLEITPPTSWEALDRTLGECSTFDWLILTSANAVEYFCDRLLALGLDGRSLAGVKIAVVGEKTAQSLRQRGLIPDFTPQTFVADALVTEFPEAVSGKKLLFPRVESGGRDLLVKEFSAQGAIMVEVPAYQSRCPEQIDPIALQALQMHQIDVITFTSSKTVQHFCHLVEAALGEAWRSALSDVCLASIGPQTSKTCQERLGRVDVEAVEYTLDGLLQALGVGV
jgi:uroporphyrinogen III methyltransferase / synthase